jgi:UDP-GlcNAc3NAcA epimerase
VELVELGWNRLVPPKSARTIFEGIVTMLDRRGSDGNPYGNGDAADKVLQSLVCNNLAAQSAKVL